MTVAAGTATQSVDSASYREERRSFGAFVPEIRSQDRNSVRTASGTYQAQTSTALGSTFSAEQVTIKGRDVAVTGSTLIATGDVSIDATRDLTITSAQNTASATTTANTSRSGVGAMGGISNGQRTVEQQASSSSTTQVGSTVASLNGNVSLSAGRDALVRASTVSAGGDITLAGSNVVIDNAMNSATSTDSYQLGEHGRTVTASSPVLQQLQGAARMAESADGAQDSRVQAMAAATAAMQASSLAQSLASGNVTAVSINISYGARSSQNATTTSVNAVAGSSLSAGGNVSVNATGKGPGQGNLAVIGSTISGGGDVALTAANDLTLQAARNTASVASTNSSHGASVGIAINLGTQNGITINAAANAADGHARGQDLTHTLATVSAGGTLSTSSGRNTTLTGAVGSGHRVVTDVGTAGSGDLTITSVQDRSTFDSQQSSAGVGVSICVPPICYGTSSASASFSRNATNNNYVGVAEQAGLRAGDGGFAVNVAGATTLTGAVIASNQAAIDGGRNTLSTATLAARDLRNDADANASGLALAVSSEQLSGGKYEVGKAVAENLAGSANAGSSSTGATRSAVSAGTVVVTDDAGQRAATGQGSDEAVASLNRDTAASHAAAQRQDVAQLEEEVRVRQAFQQQVVRQAEQFTDEAYRVMFVKNHPMFEVVKDESGKTVFDPTTGKPVLRELSEQERLNLRPGTDGKVHIAANGIFNDADAAGKYADQHGTTTGPQYVIHFPEASNTVAELLVAGYQKFLEGDVLGLTNSTTQVVGAMTQYGQTGLQLDGHSRGSLTIGNALDSMTNQPSSQGSLSGTTINFFGPAQNVSNADRTLSGLQNRPAMTPDQQTDATIKYQSHMADPVGGIIGLNPSTGGTLPQGSSRIGQAARAATGQENTPHNCYGNSRAERCRDFWQDGRRPLLSPAPAPAPKTASDDDKEKNGSGK